MITYLVDNKVNILGVVKGREKADVVKFLRKIPASLRKTVEAVCCDLYDGYMNACKEVFEKNTPVVADRFHVRKLYRKSLIKLRKSELARLKKLLTKDEYAGLKAAISIVRKQKDYFTEEEKPIVEKLLNLSPKLREGYKFSRELTAIFDSHISESQAKEKIAEWIAKVNQSNLSCFDSFITTLNKYGSSAKSVGGWRLL